MTVYNLVVVTNESDITVARRLHETAEKIHNSRVGKAPPIHTFTGENCDVLWEDWLPTFEWAAHWNG